MKLHAYLSSLLKKKKKKKWADLLYKTWLDFTRESAKLKGVLILMFDSNVFFFSTAMTLSIKDHHDLLWKTIFEDLCYDLWEKMVITIDTILRTWLIHRLLDPILWILFNSIYNQLFDHLQTKNLKFRLFRYYI